MDKFSDEYIEKVGDFEGAEEISNLSAINEDEYEKMSEEERENLKENWLNSSASELRKEVNIMNEYNSIFDLYRKYIRYREWKKSGEKEEEKANGGLIILDPDFQRENVWGLKKKQDLIESVLLGIPLPAFYFSEDKFGNYIVVDGKQRLTTFFEFMHEGMNLGNNLRPLVHNKAKATHEDFESKLRNKFEDFKLNCYVVSSNTSPIIQNEIFLRVNRGGITLNKQEIRNALNQGEVTRLLTRISQNNEIEFVAKNRKKDQYISLRFLAFFLYRTNESFIEWYLNQIELQELKRFNVDVLLDLTMKYINEMPIDFSKSLYQLFVGSYKKTQWIFNELQQAPFSRGDSKVVNMNIFEVWMYLMTKISFNEEDTGVISFLREEYMNMINDSGFVDKILYLRDQEERVNYRFTYVENILKKLAKGI
ncbi:DUF262 domain-containing protein [Streptococcus suis]|nr:DUF262 domain-containing protein [Streptococcus suis]